MPYFERKPYADFEAIANLASPSSTESASNVMENSLLVRQAADILREQSPALPRWGTAEPFMPFSDELSVARNSAWNPASVLSALPSSSAAAATIAPVVLTAAPSKSGRQVRIPVSLINDSNDDVPLALHFTDLVSLAGDRIPSTAVSCIRPASSVSSGGVLNADIDIQIPEIPPGEYWGLMACRDALPAILAVTVSA